MGVFFLTAHEKGFKFHAQPQTGTYSCVCRECGLLIISQMQFCVLYPLIPKYFLAIYLFSFDSQTYYIITRALDRMLSQIDRIIIEFNIVLDN